MKKLFILSWVFFIYSAPAHAFTLSNFETPESMIVDPEDGSYYVSNVNGGMTTKDANGYISRISPRGNLVIQKFLGGKSGSLDAPKGLALIGKEIYVTDIDTVKVFDKKSRKLLRVIDFTPFNAKFLNDITHDFAGTLYVSDTTGNQIFKIDSKKNYQPSLFKQGEELGHPNGLLFNPKSKNLMVASWEPGRLLEIDRSGRVHVLKKGFNHLDGMDFDAQSNLYVSNFDKGEIYRIPFFGRGQLSTYISGLKTPADISFDQKKNELLVPSFTGNTVSTFNKSKNHEV